MGMNEQTMQHEISLCPSMAEQRVQQEICSEPNGKPHDADMRATGPTIQDSVSENRCWVNPSLPPQEPRLCGDMSTDADAYESLAIRVPVAKIEFAPGPAARFLGEVFTDNASKQLAANL